MAFEGFAELLSGKYGMKIWRKFRKYKAAGDMEAQAAALFPAVVDSLVDHYYGFVMQSATGMHKAARNQRFYASLVASYHGLSLTGMDMLSSYGYTMPACCTMPLGEFYNNPLLIINMISSVITLYLL